MWNDVNSIHFAIVTCDCMCEALLSWSLVLLLRLKKWHGINKQIEFKSCNFNRNRSEEDEIFWIMNWNRFCDIWSDFIWLQFNILFSEKSQKSTFTLKEDSCLQSVIWVWWSFLNFICYSLLWQSRILFG